MEELTHVLYDDIIADPDAFPNARCDFKDLEALSENIETRGLLVPITLWRTTDGRHILADGIRRYAAIELVRERNPSRWDDLFGDGIPAKLLLCSKEDAVDISVLLNVHRESYNQAEEALAFDILRRQGRAAKEISALTGRSVRHINRLLAFKDDATEETFDSCARGEISFAQAQAISRRAKEEQSGAIEQTKKEAAKPAGERDLTAVRNEMTKLANQERDRVKPEPRKPGRPSGARKPSRPRVSEVRSKLETVNGGQESLIKQYEGRPKEAKDLDKHPAHAGHVVHFQYQMGFTEGARAALEWMLGDRDDVH